MLLTLRNNIGSTFLEVSESGCQIEGVVTPSIGFIHIGSGGVKTGTGENAIVSLIERTDAWKCDSMERYITLKTIVPVRRIVRNDSPQGALLPSITVCNQGVKYYGG